MLRTMQMLTIGAGLFGSAALAGAQTIEHTFEGTADPSNASAMLTVLDDHAELLLYDTKIELPPRTERWTRFEVRSEDGDLLCTVTRPTTTSQSYTMRLGGMPDWEELGIAPRIPRPPVAPRLFPFAEVPAAPQPKVMLGVHLDAAPAEEVAAAGYDPESAALISHVIESSPAAESGIEQGDVIVGIGGRPAGGMETIRDAMRGLEPGDELEVVLVRDGDVMRKRVTLAAYDPQTMSSVGGGAMVFGDDGNANPLGERVDEINRQLSELKARIGATRGAIAGSDDPERLRELAVTMRELSERIVRLNRSKAELAAKRAAQLERLIEDNVEQQVFREFNLRPLERRGPGDDGPEMGLRGRFFIERNGEDGPFVLEREFDLSRDLPRQIEGLIRAFEGEDQSRQIRELLEMLQLRVESGREQKEEVIEEVEGRVSDMESRFDDRLTDLEGRLERIERMLERALGDR